jgi:serine/threonine protein kinase
MMTLVLPATCGTASESSGSHAEPPQPVPLAEQDGQSDVVPRSRLPLTKFRELEEYRLFWPDGKTEVRPGERPLSDKECYDQLSKNWQRLPNTTHPTKNTQMYYVQLKATQGTTPEQPLDLVHTYDFVAVKEIIVTHEEDGARLKEAQTYAQDEFRHLSKIQHCHIIASLDMIRYQRTSPWTEVPQDHFITLLYPLAVRNLAEHLEWSKSRRDHQTPEQLINFLPCLCQAVLYLHNFTDPINENPCSPMRHRDIKPENILVDFHDGNFGILLADFDISKQYDDIESAATSGVTSITKQYAAGVLLGDGQKRPRSFETDIISLGFVFLEVLTVVLGASRYEMFKSFPTAEGEYYRNNSGSFCHGKALELGDTQKWIEHLQHRIRTEEIPERLRNGAAEHMIRQIIQMMKTEFGAKGVLEEAYMCFSTIADPCVHCSHPPEPFEHQRCLSNDKSYPTLDVSTSKKQKSKVPLQCFQAGPLMERPTTSERSSLGDQGSLLDLGIDADPLTSNDDGFALRLVSNIHLRSQDVPSTYRDWS